MEELNGMKVSTNDGGVFFAEEVGVIHNPLRFIIDFTSTTPRNDLTGGGLRLVVNHSVVMMDPWKTKEFLNALKENIKRYEDEFGAIQTPSAIKKIKKSMKKNAGKKARAKMQDYFG